MYQCQVFRLGVVGRGPCKVPTVEAPLAPLPQNSGIKAGGCPLGHPRALRSFCTAVHPGTAVNRSCLGYDSRAAADSRSRATEGRRMTGRGHSVKPRCRGERGKQYPQQPRQRYRRVLTGQGRDEAAFPPEQRGLSRGCLPGLSTGCGFLGRERPERAVFYSCG